MAREESTGEAAITMFGRVVGSVTVTTYEGAIAIPPPRRRGRACGHRADRSPTDVSLPHWTGRVHPSRQTGPTFRPGVSPHFERHGHPTFRPHVGPGAERAEQEGPHAGHETPMHRGAPDTDAAIRDAATAAGVDEKTMRAMASIESSMNPDSYRNRGTQYKGLYQIGHDEWARYGSGDIYNTRQRDGDGAHDQG
jgi:hypothetical protein